MKLDSGKLGIVIGLVAFAFTVWVYFDQNTANEDLNQRVQNIESVAGQFEGYLPENIQVSISGNRKTEYIDGMLTLFVANQTQVKRSLKEIVVSDPSGEVEIQNLPDLNKILDAQTYFSNIIPRDFGDDVQVCLVVEFDDGSQNKLIYEFLNSRPSNFVSYDLIDFTELIAASDC